MAAQVGPCWPPGPWFPGFWCWEHWGGIPGCAHPQTTLMDLSPTDQGRLGQWVNLGISCCETKFRFPFEETRQAFTYSSRGMLHIREISNCLRQNLEESTGNVLEKNYVSGKKKKKELCIRVNETKMYIAQTRLGLSLSCLSWAGPGLL